MNNKLMLTKFALSTALLISVVANPAISSAASTAKSGEFQTQNKTILSASMEGTKAISVTQSFNNPLEVVKKYAPDTLNDWTKTLALFDKTIGAIQSNVIPSLEAVPLDTAALETIALTSVDLSSSTLAVNISADKVASIGEFHAVSPTNSVTTMNMVTSALDAVEANNFHFDLFNAQIELAKAVETEDATTIKQSLSKLLEQYKNQIVQWESEQ